MVTTKEGMCILRKYLNNIDFRKKKGKHTYLPKASRCGKLYQDVESNISNFKMKACLSQYREVYFMCC
jgi:hypothetical protein